MCPLPGHPGDIYDKSFRLQGLELFYKLCGYDITRPHVDKATPWLQPIPIQPNSLLNI